MGSGSVQVGFRLGSVWVQVWLWGFRLAQVGFRLGSVSVQVGFKFGCGGSGWVPVGFRLDSGWVQALGVHVGFRLGSGWVLVGFRFGFGGSGWVQVGFKLGSHLAFWVKRRPGFLPTGKHNKVALVVAAEAFEGL